MLIQDAIRSGKRFRRSTWLQGKWGKGEGEFFHKSDVLADDWEVEETTNKGAEVEEKKTHPYHVGKNYFIRTVTHHLTGKLVKVGLRELVLMDAAWIADDGRFADAFKTGQFKEVEPYPEGMEVIVGRGSLIDAIEWKFPLPRDQK